MSQTSQPLGAPRVPLIVIGGGAAGMMAAIAAAEAGVQVILLERGPRCGRKLLLTGGSRCNLTHRATPKQLLQSVGPDPRFLRKAVFDFSPEMTVDHFHRLGVPTVVEPDGCVFPASNRAEDVAEALQRRMAELHVCVQLRRRVVSVGRIEGGLLVRTADGSYLAERLIVATGGVSYPTTGSSGDGYDIARALGHTVLPIKSALAALETVESWPGELAGISFDDAKLTARSGDTSVSVTGDLLFAGWGISGPAALRLCWQLADVFDPPPKPVEVTVDLRPDAPMDRVEADLQWRFDEDPKKQLGTVLRTLDWPASMVELLCRQFDLPAACRCGEISKKVRRRIVSLVKALPLTVCGPREPRHATAVRGGVSTDEIDPSTMQSTVCPGLYFAGELMNVDGDCGGYNLQIAWSTGRLAGRSTAR